MAGLLTFADPWLLGFLAVLPVIWWLLRLMPPAPKLIRFPALALLRDLKLSEQTPARTPWWLLLLRLVIAVVLIAAFARPLLTPATTAAVHDGGSLIVIDNDWASARNWDSRQEILHDIVKRAEQENRQLALLTTAPPADGSGIKPPALLDAKLIAGMISQLQPLPWSSDYPQATAELKKLDHAKFDHITWLASGTGGQSARNFYNVLHETGSVQVLSPPAPLYNLAGSPDNASLTITRADASGAASLLIDAMSAEGTSLQQVLVTMGNGSPQAIVTFNLPATLRNQIVRFGIEGQHSAAATVLLDSSWQHRPVGIVGDGTELDQHSLLNGLYYIDRALSPTADLHVDRLEQLVQAKMAVIILPDNASIYGADVPAVTDWVKHGGVLVRFAGSDLNDENARVNTLLPVPLRTADRALGGSLSWTAPQKLQAFAAESPFHGLALPDDVTVSRQVLAEPTPELATATWAALVDGTPLVTGKALGQGYTVLFHVPARSDWSNLPLSGLFVQMLQRLIDLSHGTLSGNVADESTRPLPALQMLNAYGELQSPNPTAQPLLIGDDPQPSPQHPPGLYGTNAYNHAFNLGPVISPVDALSGIPIDTYQTQEQASDLQPYLLALAFILLLGDFLISMHLRGISSATQRKLRPAAVLVLLVLLLPTTVRADEKTPVELTSKTYLAYVKTGDRNVDQISDEGLKGLAAVIQQRTAIDPVDETGIDPNSDELAFYPLIYWPLTSNTAPLSQQGANRVSDYLRHGGMILFDTLTGETASPALLHQLLGGVAIPPLVTLPADHVLKRSFYLLDQFPGRFDRNEFWLEAGDPSRNDGVATVLYGVNDWAAAWAIDAQGQFLYPCIPGGEEQREQAFRFGINLVMYALTGNYKSDQLKATALLNKFGQ